MSIGRKFLRIITQTGSRNSTCQNCLIVSYFRRIYSCIHFLQISKCMSQSFRWDFQSEGENRFQENILCHHKALPDSTVGCLSEISAFGMFHTGAAVYKRDSHICQVRSCQYAFVTFFFQMCENQMLPVAIQKVS